MTWDSASALARSGSRVRRAGWRDRWMVFHGFLFFAIPVNVRTLAESADADFTAAEFVANDWTTDPMPIIEITQIEPDAVLTITYDWSGTGKSDFDSWTEMLGERVGYSAGNIIGTAHIDMPAHAGSVYGDDRRTDGYEEAIVHVGSAREDGLWDESVDIVIRGQWYPSWAGPIAITVQMGGVSETRSVSATHAFADYGPVTVNSDGTWVWT